MSEVTNSSPKDTLLFMYKHSVRGHTIDHTWNKIIRWKKTKKNPKGKPHLEAIMLLSEIYYWNTPTVSEDESGQTFIKKKFRADILQRSYAEIEERLGIEKYQAVEAFKTLESLGIAKREFRTIDINGTRVSNILYIRFFPQKLSELTDEFLKYLESYPKFEGEGSLNSGIPVPPISSYTNTTTESSTESSTEEPPPTPPKGESAGDFADSFEEDSSEEKEEYGPDGLVKLTMKQYETLLKLPWGHKVDSLIEELALYIGSSGKRYKSHFYTIQDWHQRKEKEKKQVKGSKHKLEEEGDKWTPNY